MTKKAFSLKYAILGSVVLALIVLVFQALIPLPKATLGNCEKRVGLVLKVIKKGGPGDIVISLKGDKNYYYINRGTDRGVSLSGLEASLTNKTIEILTVKHWSLLNPASTTKHIAQVSLDGSVIYSEL